jgi:hypothetical protein
MGRSPWHSQTLPRGHMSRITRVAGCLRARAISGAAEANPGSRPAAGAAAGESGRGRAPCAAGTRAFPECPNRSRTDYVPSSTVRVCYRYHPLFNREAQVVRRCPNVPPDGILIVLPDGSRCVLPSWMLDPVVCSSFTDDSDPRIALSALWALRQLIDKSLPLSKPSVTSGAPANTGGDHAQAKDSATSSAVLHRQRLVETISSGPSRSLPPPPRPVARPSGRSRSPRKESQ